MRGGERRRWEGEADCARQGEDGRELDEAGAVGASRREVEGWSRPELWSSIVMNVASLVFAHQGHHCPVCGIEHSHYVNQVRQPGTIVTSWRRFLPVTGNCFPSCVVHLKVVWVRSGCKWIGTGFQVLIVLAAPLTPAHLQTCNHSQLVGSFQIRVKKQARRKQFFSFHVLQI